MAKIGKKDVKVFANAIKRFMTYFGLGDWEITLLQRKIEEFEDDTLAIVICDGENCCVEFNIQEEWPDHEPVTVDNLEKVALHEVLHVLFFAYDRLAKDRYITAKQLADAEHDIIRRMVMFYVDIRDSKQ